MTPRWLSTSPGLSVARSRPRAPHCPPLRPRSRGSVGRACRFTPRSASTMRTQPRPLSRTLLTSRTPTRSANETCTWRSCRCPSPSSTSGNSWASLAPSPPSVSSTTHAESEAPAAPTDFVCTRQRRTRQRRCPASTALQSKRAPLRSACRTTLSSKPLLPSRHPHARIPRRVRGGEQLLYPTRKRPRRRGQNRATVRRRKRATTGLASIHTIVASTIPLPPTRAS
mmetsp:Transcript_14668/g.45466  ORF Transcript_14668/g.45466 Transcript_14668/m.45466 type:complete len:226 (+) Transcript_14668:200-877(+)